MNRRGFALVAVLWVLAMVGAIAGVALAVAREGRLESSNRLALTRGRWAAEACEGIFRGRFAANEQLTRLDTVDLGRGTWCVAALEDPDGLVSINTATPTVLRRILGSDSLVDALVDWRDLDTIPRPLGAEASWYRAQGRALPRNGPLASLEELRLVRGFEEVRLVGLTRILTVSSTRAVDVNIASTEVLQALGVFDASALARIQVLRLQGRHFDGFDELLGALDAGTRTRLAAEGPELARVVGFGSERRRLRIAGGVRGWPAVWRTTVDVVPSGRRLAVISRVLE